MQQPISCNLNIYAFLCPFVGRLNTTERLYHIVFIDWSVKIVLTSFSIVWMIGRTTHSWTLKDTAHKHTNTSQQDCNMTAASQRLATYANYRLIVNYNKAKECNAPSNLSRNHWSGKWLSRPRHLTLRIVFHPLAKIDSVSSRSWWRCTSCVPEVARRSAKSKRLPPFVSRVLPVKVWRELSEGYCRWLAWKGCPSSRNSAKRKTKISRSASQLGTAEHRGNLSQAKVPENTRTAIVRHWLGSRRSNYLRHDEKPRIKRYVA